MIYTVRTWFLQDYRNRNYERFPFCSLSSLLLLYIMSVSCSSIVCTILKIFFSQKIVDLSFCIKKEENGSSCFAKFILARNRFLLTSLFSLLKNFFSFKIGNTIFCISKIRIKIKLLLYSVFQEFFFVLLKTTVLPPGGSLQLFSPFFVMCLACPTT